MTQGLTKMPKEHSRWISNPGWQDQEDRWEKTMPELSPENKYELSQELVDREFQAWAAAGTKAKGNRTPCSVPCKFQAGGQEQQATKTAEVGCIQVTKNAFKSYF